VAKNLVPAPDIKETVIALKERYPTNLENVDVDRIIFWRDISPKKKRAYAYVKRIDDMDKMVNPNYDYHFVVNDASVKHFSPAQMNGLCFHEALHIGPPKVDSNGNVTATIVKHDLMEFFVVVAALGFDWEFNPACRDLLGDEKVELRERPVKDEDGVESEGPEEDPQFV